MNIIDKFNTLPLTFKVLIVISILNVLTALTFLQQSVFFLFGVLVTGIAANLLKIILNLIAPIALIYLLLNRTSFTWKYTVAYLAFFTLNGIISLISFALQIPPGLFDFMLLSILTGVIVIIVNAVLLLFTFKNKGAFEVSKKK